MSSDATYETDFFLWTQDQAERLRAEPGRGGNSIDYVNLAEEIESLGRRDRRELESRLETILIHLFKLAASYSVEPRRGWQATIRRERQRVKRILADSPSLRAQLAVLVEDVTESSRRQASDDLSDYGEDEDAALVRLGAFSGVVERILEDNFFPYPPESPPTSTSA